MPGVSLTPEAPAQAPAEPSVPGGFDIPGHSGPNAVQIPGNDPSVAVVSGFVGGLGEIIDSYEAIIGRDFFSGDALTPGQRSAAFVGFLIPGLGRRLMEAGGGVIHFLGNFFKKAKPAASEADTVIKSAPEVDCPDGRVNAPKTVPTARLPQDINVNPTPPPALPLNRAIGASPTQNAAMQADIAAARAQGATDFRVNQQQVNAAGQRVGVNRPDLQYTDANGRRVYIEYDTTASTRGPEHQNRIMANDPNGTVILNTID